MEPIDLTTKVRDHYLNGYRRAIADTRETSPEAVTELLIEIGGDKLDGVYKLYRIDIASGGAGSPQLMDFNQDSYLDFPPVSFRIDDSLHVSLHPMYWNGVELKVSGLPSDWQVLEQWIQEWLDISDEHKPDVDGLTGVIHSVTAPEIHDETWEISLDLGSAPSDAFWALLRSLATAGCKRVEVGSFSMIESRHTT